MPPFLISLSVFSAIFNARGSLLRLNQRRRKVKLCGTGNFGAGLKPPHIGSKLWANCSKPSFNVASFTVVFSACGGEESWVALVIIYPDVLICSRSFFHKDAMCSR